MLIFLAYFRFSLYPYTYERAGYGHIKSIARHDGRDASISRNCQPAVCRDYQIELIPPSKISGLTQGVFVGSVSDNFDERIEQKIFHAEIVIDAEKVRREEKAYKPIPVITDFTDSNGKDCMQETVLENYNRIKAEVRQIVAEELERMSNNEKCIICSD